MRFLKYLLWGLAGIFLVTRLVNLTGLPIFTDEANYLNWGWFELHGHPWYSLFDAKQPGLMWILAAAEMAGRDPLWAGRAVSILTGLLNLWGIWLVGKKLGGEKVAAAADVVYIITPLFLFYDRQALMESALISVSVFSFYFLLQTYEKPTLKSAAATGAILGIGLWIKSSALVFLAAAVTSFGLMAVSRRGQVFKYLTAMVYMLAAFLAVAGLLILQPQFTATWSRNSDYTMTLSQMARWPWPTWKADWILNGQLWLILLTPVVTAGWAAGMVIMGRKNWLTAAWIWLPLGIYLTFAKFSGALFQRYATPYLALIVIPAGFTLARIKPGFWSLLILPIAVSLLQIFNPAGYFNLVNKFTRYSYLQGYITGSDSGYQVQAILKYLRRQAKSGPIVTGLQLANFNPTAGVMVYARREPGLNPYYIDTRVPDADKYACLSSPRPVYLVSVGDLGDLEKFMQPVKVIGNNYGREKNVIYTLKTGCAPATTAPLELISMDAQ